MGSGSDTVPQCPFCFFDLAVVTGRLPITLVCPHENRFFLIDFEDGMLHPIPSPYPLSGFFSCMQCGAGLTYYENLPPRATCESCEVDYSLDPLRPAPPCGLCEDQVRIVEGAMPPQGDCIGCGVEALLADAPEPFAPPIEITVQAVLATPRRSLWSRLREWFGG